MASENKPNLTICMPCKSDICALSAGSILSLSGAKELLTLATISPRFAIGQSDLPKARSEQLTTWYKESKPGDLFMFIDSDQTFTAQDIRRSLIYILEGKHDIVCGAYSRRNNTLTVEPKNVISFFRDKEGPLWYGATGFMLMTYEIVDKLAKILGSEAKTSLTASAYPFFYERIVSEPELNRTNLWLGEDYSFCWLARQHGASLYGYVSPTIGHIIPVEKFVVLPKISDWPRNSIVVYCGKTAEPWSGKSLQRGIGGSELAVIKLTRYWASFGYDVTVYCHCDEPGVYDGVKYVGEENFSFVDTYDILVIWRSTEVAGLVDFRARRCLLDLHDVVKPGAITARLLKTVDKICVKSKYHAGMLGDIPADKVAVITNGGAYEHDNKEQLPRDLDYIIYTSSYDRGLAYMLKWGWPRIKQACPNAYLKVFYGWNGFDALQPKTPDTQLYKQIVVDLLKQDGISECGRVPQEQLLREKEQANIHWYTGDFSEIDCISVRESAWLGAIPVVSKRIPVFEEKTYCQLIDGDPHTEEMQKRAADRIIDLLTNKDETEKLRANMIVPRDESWERVARKWEEFFR